MDEEEEFYYLESLEKITRPKPPEELEGITEKKTDRPLRRNYYSDLDA